MSEVHDMTGQDRAVEELLKHVRDSTLSTGGGGPYDGGGGNPPMERVAALEAQIGNVEHRFDGLDTRLDRIEDKIPSKWDMAQVVFFVVGGLMAAAIFGPRIAAMIPTAP